MTAVSDGRLITYDGLGRKLLSPVSTVPTLVWKKHKTRRKEPG